MNNRIIAGIMGIGLSIIIGGITNIGIFATTMMSLGAFGLALII